MTRLRTPPQCACAGMGAVVPGGGTRGPGAPRGLSMRSTAAGAWRCAGLCAFPRLRRARNPEVLPRRPVCGLRGALHAVSRSPAPPRPLPPCPAAPAPASTGTSPSSRLRAASTKSVGVRPRGCCRRIAPSRAGPAGRAGPQRARETPPSPAALGRGRNVVHPVASESRFPPCPVPRCGEKPAGSQEQPRPRRAGVGAREGDSRVWKGELRAGGGLLRFPSVWFQMLVDQSDSYLQAVYSPESVSKLFEMGRELPQTLRDWVTKSVSGGNPCSPLLHLNAMCSVHHSLCNSSNCPLFSGFFGHSAITLQPSFIFFCRLLSLLFVFVQCTKFCRGASWFCCRILDSSIVTLQSGGTVHWEGSWMILPTGLDDLFWQQHPDATFPWSLVALPQL